jgi:hypothetical protein
VPVQVSESPPAVAGAGRVAEQFAPPDPFTGVGAAQIVEAASDPAAATESDRDLPQSPRLDSRPPATPALAAPKVGPARSEADALTVFGARGEAAPRPRRFTFLHLAAAALVVGVLFSVSTFLGRDTAETGIVELEDIAMRAEDPLTEAGGEVA